jgi:hypothetical protein
VRALLVLSLLAGCETGGPPDFSAKLVAHYPLEDTNNGKVVDTSGNHRDGACTFCPLVEAAGKSGAALRFDGGDQQVDVDPNTAFDDVIRGFSAAAWIKLDMAPPQLPGCAMVKGMMWSICITPQLEPAFGEFAANAMITVGDWHHIAISYDGKQRRIVLDGAEAGTMAGTIKSDPGQLVIGAELIGLADDAQVFSGVLTDEEIAMLITP